MFLFARGKTYMEKLPSILFVWRLKGRKKKALNQDHFAWAIRQMSSVLFFFLFSFFTCVNICVNMTLAGASVTTRHLHQCTV